MLPTPSRPSDGPSALDAYGEALELHETTLRNRFDRKFYRKELRAKAKYYSTLAAKRPEGGEARPFYEALSGFLARQLEAYGLEEPAKRRRKPDAPTAPLVYPDLPEEFSYRVHFLERGSLKRERSAAVAKHADAVSRQTAPNGEVLLSVAVSPARVQFFERLIESIGTDRLGAPPRARRCRASHISVRSLLSACALIRRIGRYPSSRPRARGLASALRNRFLSYGLIPPADVLRYWLMAKGRVDSSLGPIPVYGRDVACRRLSCCIIFRHWDSPARCTAKTLWSGSRRRRSEPPSPRH